MNMLNQKSSAGIEGVSKVCAILIGVMCLGAAVAAGIFSYANPGRNYEGGWVLAMLIGPFGGWMLYTVWTEQCQRHKLGIVCVFLAICVLMLSFVAYDQSEKAQSKAADVVRLEREHARTIQNLKGRVLSELHFAYARGEQYRTNCARYQTDQSDKRFLQCMENGSSKGRLEAKQSVQNIFRELKE